MQDFPHTIRGASLFETVADVSPDETDEIERIVESHTARICTTPDKSPPLDLPTGNENTPIARGSIR